MSDAKQQSTSGPVASPQHTSKFETKGLFNTATVALHTGQVELVWNGRQTKPNLAGIRPPGAVSVALVSGALRYLFLATSTDNPWADFALLRFQNAIANVREVCAERTATIKNLIAMRTASTSVTTSLVSRQTPHVFELVLYTPYHGLLVDTLAEWDNTVRHVLTFNAAGRMDSVTTRALVDSLRNLMVNALEQVMADAGHVRRAIVPITRALLWNTKLDAKIEQGGELGEGKTAAIKGATTASKTLAKKFRAELPDDVLTGVSRPDHRRQMDRRRLNLPVKT